MFADSIALSKGEGTLPPLTRDNCQLVVRAAFLPANHLPRSEVTQIVGWFDPLTLQPSSVEQIDHVSRHELEWHAHADNCMQTDILASRVRLCFSCRPVSLTPVPLPAPTARRTMHVPLAGAHNNVWHDGYLAHYSAAGQVLSLLTDPGEARLYVPQLPRSQQGTDPAARGLAAACPITAGCVCVPSLPPSAARMCSKASSPSPSTTPPCLPCSAWCCSAVCMT